MKTRRNEQTLIRISVGTLNRIRILAKKLGYAQITTLEYLLNGKIDLNELYLKKK